MNDWIGPAITGVSSIIVSLITVWLKTYLDARKEAKKHAADEGIAASDLGEMIFVHDYIEQIRKDHGFDRVSICQFHNGGKFFNGRSMKKFSMTYESAAPGYERIKRTFQNVLVSEFPDVIQKMLDEEVVINTVDDSIDNAFRRDMENIGIQQCVKVPILGLKGGLAGFMMCHNISKINNINEEEKKSLVDHANILSGYIIK